MERRKVILFYPAYEGLPLGAPVCLLAVAASLREAGFRPVLIDAAIEPDYKNRACQELEGACCLGISVLTGPMIRGAIEVAKAVKVIRPKVPVVFGAWHPTLMPDETLAEHYVDIVVRGQGEVTICELVNALVEKRSLRDVAGISWKIDVMRTHNPDRTVETLETCRCQHMTWSILTRMNGSVVVGSWPTPPVLGVRMPVIIVPIWCFTSGGSMRFPQSALCKR
jgi:radical SAM superfamily enzyme YgiQ (UPF0313 family)